MLTFRAQTHQQDDVKVPSYAVYEADTYTVKSMDRGGFEIKLYRGSFPIYSDDSLSLYVGPQDLHGIVYVMNSTGKTIDTIS